MKNKKKGISGLQRYTAVLSLPNAKKFFFTASLGRLAVTTHTLGILLYANSRYEGFASSALVASIFLGAEAIGGPIIASIVDRRGQRTVLRWLIPTHAILMLLLIIFIWESQILWIVIPVSALSGASAPQFGPLSAARWATISPNSSYADRGFSLEGAANDTAFVIGPVLAGILASAVNPIAPPIFATVVALGSASYLSAQTETEPTPQNSIKQVRSIQTLIRFGWLTILFIFILNFFLGNVFGSLQVGVTTLTETQNRDLSAGLLYASLSIGSLFGSFCYGLIEWHQSYSARTAMASAVILGGSTALLLFSFGLITPAILFFIGIGIGPVFIISGTLIGRIVQEGSRTTAFATVGACSALGIAVGGPFAGARADTVGYLGAVQYTAVAAALMVITAAVSFFATPKMKSHKAK